jgi:hypothetical protein
MFHTGHETMFHPKDWDVWWAWLDCRMKHLANLVDCQPPASALCFLVRRVLWQRTCAQTRPLQSDRYSTQGTPRRLPCRQLQLQLRPRRFPLLA